MSKEKSCIFGETPSVRNNERESFIGKRAKQITASELRKRQSVNNPVNVNRNTPNPNKVVGIKPGK